MKTPKEIEAIRKALEGFTRPCESGTCEYQKNGACSKWDCVPEKELIDAALKSVA